MARTKWTKWNVGLAVASMAVWNVVLPAAGVFAQSAPSLTLSANAEQVNPGSTVTFTATGSGLPSNAEYQFWVEQPNGSWTVAQDYSSNNTFTLTVGSQPGDYLVEAYAMTPQEIAAGDWSAAVPSNNGGALGVFVDSSVSITNVSPTTPTVGQPVTVTAQATGIYDPQYQFWYEDPSGAWHQSGDYSGSNTFTFTPNAAGTYSIIVYAKSPLALNNPQGAVWSQVQTVQCQMGQPTLSPITVSGATAGTGSSSSPAVALQGSSLTLSTTLTDAMGNPLPNTAVTFNVTEYGSLPQYAPTVANASGTVLAPTQTSSADQYTVYTNSQGVATIQMSGPVGQTYAYEVVAAAPYGQSSGLPLTSQPAYVEFVTNGQVGLSPLASSGSPFGASLGQSVPITVTLPPNASGQPQANVLVTLSVTVVSGSGTAYFTNSSGADLGTTVQVATNASGLAQTFLTSSSSGEFEVQVSLPSSLGLTNPNPTYIGFNQAATPAKIINWSVTSNSVQAGQDVTVFGTVVDANGNPVPNGQILVVGNDLIGSGDFGYVSGTTITDFPTLALSGTAPSASVVVPVGTQASSAVGDLVTTDAAGNFSVTVTDTKDTAQYAVLSVYPVANGEVSGGALESADIQITSGTTLAKIALAGSASALGAHATTLNGGTATNHTDVPLWFQAQNASGNPIAGESFTFTVSVNNGGTIDAVGASDAAAGTYTTVGTSGSVATSLSSQLPSNQLMPIAPTNPGLGALTVTETYYGPGSAPSSLPDGNSNPYSGSPTGEYVVSVPGYGDIAYEPSASGTAAPAIALGVYDSNTGTTTVTVTSGAESSTATFDFTGGAPSYVQQFTPATVNLVSSNTEQVTFQLQDDQGNPVPNAAATIAAGGSDPVWVTAVNGVTLQQSENMGTAQSAVYNTEPTPIPLGTPPSNLGYTSVDIAGAVAWTAGGLPEFYSNANGDVTLTLQANGVQYYAGLGGQGVNSPTGQGEVLTANAPASGSVGVFTFPSKSVSAQALGVPYELVISNTTPPSFTYSGTTYSWQQLGTITWTGPSSTSSQVSASNSTVVLSSSTMTAGTTLTVSGIVENSNGLPVPGASVAVSFDGVSGTTTTNGLGAYSVTLTPTTAVTSSPVTVTANGTQISTASDTVTVTPAALAKFVISGLTMGTATTTATVTAEDQYGNTVTSVTSAYAVFTESDKDSDLSTDDVAGTLSIGGTTIGSTATQFTLTNGTATISYTPAKDNSAAETTADTPEFTDTLTVQDTAASPTVTNSVTNSTAY